MNKVISLIKSCPNSLVEISMSPTVANLDDPHLERTSCKPKPTSPKTSKRTIIQAKNLFILDLFR